MKQLILPKTISSFTSMFYQLMEIAEIRDFFIGFAIHFSFIYYLVGVRIRTSLTLN